VPYIERLKRPKLEIKPVSWQPTGPVYPMTFASAQVLNKPLRGPLGRFLNRDAAESCEVTIDFFTWGDQASRKRVFDPIKGRWDSHPQPLKIRSVPSYTGFSDPLAMRFPAGYAGGTVPTSYTDNLPSSLPGTIPVSHMDTVGGGYSGHATSWHVEYDSSLDTPQQDISVGSDRGQISVAILKDGAAFAFANESYDTPPRNHLCRPAWKLTLGETYQIEIGIKGSNVDHKQIFKLYVTDDFSAFKLQEVVGAAIRLPLPRQERPKCRSAQRRQSGGFDKGRRLICVRRYDSRLVNACCPCESGAPESCSAPWLAADDSVTPWSSSPSPDLFPATWPRPVLSQAPPSNPIAADPDGRRVLSGGGAADHEVTPQAPLTGSGCREHSYGGFEGGHPHFHPHAPDLLIRRSMERVRPVRRNPYAQVSVLPGVHQRRCSPAPSGQSVRKL
jgi:hypothetical protein